jgi:hypothetical protein
MLLAAILPAVVDLVKNGIGAATTRFIGLSVDDQIKLEEAAVKRLEALAKLDNPGGTPSLWVINLRASFRYIMAGLLILGGLGTIWYGFDLTDPVARAAVLALGAEIAGTPFSFIFGERLYLGLKGAKK